MNSVWVEDVRPASFDALKGDVTTDVLIIGGGLTGILCARMLKKAGVDCILVEADRICGGITKNTTAKVTLQHGLIYDGMIRRFGADFARLYLEAQRDACRQYEKLCAEISCDYETRDSYVYSRNDRDRILREVTAIQRLGGDAAFSEARELPFEVAGAVRVRDQAQMHPLKFAYGVARDLPIYEKTKVLEIGKRMVITSRGTVRPKRIVLATHFPMLNKHGGYFLKMYQSRSYVLALKGAADVDGMYVDAAEDGLSFRTYGDLLLLGGGGHRTGKKGGGWRELEDFAARYYPSARVAHRWATQDCMTLDGVPYIGQYAPSTPNLYVASGYNKWGMTSSMVAANLLTDLICGKKTPYARVFDPARNIWRPQLAVNAFESVVGLLTPTVPRCPHLGCALKYNAQEHSWDCPCHGSRFTDEGELIDNPATDDKKL